MLALLQLDLYPCWALGPAFNDLEAAGRDATPPARLMWACEDAILLAPWRADEHHWAGFLVMQDGAAGTTQEFVDERGAVVWLTVPADLARRGAVLAVAGQHLPIAAGPSAGC